MKEQESSHQKLAKRDKRRLYQEQTTKSIYEERSRSHREHRTSDEHWRVEIKPLTKRQIMLASISLHLIDKIDFHQTFQCRYQLFHIPYMLTLAEILSLYTSKQQQLFVYARFKQELKIVAQLNKLQPIQLPEQEGRNAIVVALKYQKGRQPILTHLRAFITKYERKMSTFMPVYNAYFKMIVDKEERINEKSSFQSVQEYILEVENSFQKFHNLDL